MARALLGFTRNDGISDQCLEDLKNCKQTSIPIYSFAEHQRLKETKYLYGATVIIGQCTRNWSSSHLTQSCIAEGIMALLDPHLRHLYDLKVPIPHFRTLQFSNACSGLRSM